LQFEDFALGQAFAMMPPLFLPVGKNDCGAIVAMKLFTVATRGVAEPHLDCRPWIKERGI
jgi:hypothetical protein